MSRVLALVEGQTEETFIREVLGPALAASGVFVTPKLLTTKRLSAGGHFKGGGSSYAQIRGDLVRLLHDSGAAGVTTMLDLYGLPSDFPRPHDLGAAKGRELAVRLEAALSLDLQEPRLIPYLSVHEFEAFAFVAPERSPTVFSERQAAQLRDVSGQFGGTSSSSTKVPRRTLRLAFGAFCRVTTRSWPARSSRSTPASTSCRRAARISAPGSNAFGRSVVETPVHPLDVLALV